MKNDSSLTIVSLMSGCPWGGSEELWFRAAIAAKTVGIRVTVWVKKWPTDHPNVILIRSKDIKVSYLTDCNPLKRANRSSFLGRINKQLSESQKILSANPDKILISQGDTFSAFDNSLFNELIASGKPVYLLSQHLHDSGIPDPAVREKISEQVGKLTKFCFVSNRSLQLVKRFLLTSGENFVCVRNPVNVKEKAIISYPKCDEARFAVVARLDCAFKGQDILLEVFSGEKWKLRNWTCNIYGDGPDRKYLENLIRYFGLDKKVFLCGHHDSIEGIWQHNHILVLPSISEGTPLALIEAHICGRAAVGVDVGGIGEMLIDNVTGWLAEAPQLSYIDNALERAWNCKDSWQKFGSNAHLSTMQKYRLDAGDELIRLIFE